MPPKPMTGATCGAMGLLALAASAALTLAGAGAVAAPAVAASGIPVGQVVAADSPEPFNGWRMLGGGLYDRRVNQNQVTRETQVCCYSVFNKGMQYLVARAEPVTKTDRGGVLTERIVATTTLTRRPTEEQTDCSLLWITPALSLYDARTKAVRSVVVTDDSLIVIAWSDPAAYCSAGD